MFLVGASYLSGIARPAEPMKAEPWFRRAAEKGHPWAIHTLGWMYDSGTGVAKDPAAAREWCRKSAELGNATSMSGLGLELLAKVARARERPPAKGSGWARPGARGSRRRPPASPGEWSAGGSSGCAKHGLRAPVS